MLIEFLKEHGCYRIGQVVVHPHPGVADTLIRRGIARPAVQAAAAAEKPAKPRKDRR